MLSEVLRIVGEQGWFDLDQPYEKAIHLSQGASLWMILTRHGQARLFLKFSRLSSLETEARRFRDASLAHPEHAPQFIGYVQQRGLHLMATTAVDFRAVTADMLARPAWAARLRLGLAGFFTSDRAATGSHAWLDDLERYYHPRRSQPAVDAGLRRLRAALPGLPARPQHGDLVLNNLGLRPDGRLIVFDWEDYEELALPGLDLFTLEWSLQQASGPSGARAPAGAAGLLDLGACCAAQGLSVDHHRELRLCHALAFRFLKRRYGPEIRERLDRLIAEG